MFPMLSVKCNENKFLLEWLRIKRKISLVSWEWVISKKKCVRTYLVLNDAIVLCFNDHISSSVNAVQDNTKIYFGCGQKKQLAMVVVVHMNTGCV